MTLRRLIVALLLIVAGVMGIAASAEAQDCHGRGLLLTCGGQPGPTLALDFTTGTLDNRISFSRASSATDLVYTATSGTYNTYANNVPRLTTQGLLLEPEQRTNYFLNSTAPATQTITLGTGKFTTWLIGSGSVTTAAGTAVGTGFGAATQGSPNTINITTGGTVTFTVSGTVTRAQVENSSFPTSFIVTAGTAATRAPEVATMALGAISFNQYAVTTYLSAHFYGADSGGFFYEVDDGTANNRFEVINGGIIQAETRTPSGVSLSAGSITSNSDYALAFAIGGGTAGFSVNGGAAITGSGANLIGGLTTLRFGAASNGVGNSSMYLKRFKLWARRLPDGQLPSVAH